MSDPAVEAAQRALTNIGYGRSGHVQRVAAAREALKPIRELHEAWSRHEKDLSADAIQLLDDFAKLIYSTEELSDEQST
ncbi:hypothetical protein GJ25_gp097 [Mycobacterium phage Hawkeye]|uniref:Uncharacterized protein n=1 Tax=Mycobacterium phage Hawkeye TaxID=1458711 RepID=X2KRM2_9CAUD|nr:hypothetical protein GJ25_gp097 [Mycobacterium phage Hawkeye]AHN84108.1 hypothetical protein PBI_HAWKEYE_97 [Mycobacterium phage Hawkeye]